MNFNIDISSAETKREKELLWVIQELSNLVCATSYCSGEVDKILKIAQIRFS